MGVWSDITCTALGRTPRVSRAITVMVLLVVAGCAGDGTAPSPRKPSVVLITIDTLRVDRCSLYGYRRPTTPFLEELATRSTVFENAYATSSWTAPSMASLFTALPPRSHGVVKGFVWDGQVIGQDYLSEEFETLAERLAAEGYDTFAVSSNGHLTAGTGFAQGFEDFGDVWWEPAGVTTARALALRDRLGAADRYFLWLHYFDPHVPYEANEPWFSEYQRIGWEQSAESRSVPAAIRRAALAMKDKYDSEINLVDASLRTLFDALPIDDALVIVTADHGEAFYDHGELGHGTSLFEEEVRVPLLIRRPNQQTGHRVDAPVSLLDLYPTILAVLGIEGPPGLGGMSLHPLLDGGEMVDRPVFTELARGHKVETTIRAGQWKLYRREAPVASTRLYDLEVDPGERMDLGPSQSERVRRLQERQHEWKRRWPRVEARRTVAPYGIHPSERDRLRALGYLE